MYIEMKKIEMKDHIPPPPSYSDFQHICLPIKMVGVRTSCRFSFSWVITRMEDVRQDLRRVKDCEKGVQKLENYY